MKKIFLALIVCSIVPAYAGFSFSSRLSELNLKQNSHFKISTPSIEIGGTVNQDPLASVSGGRFVFQEGRLIDKSQTMLLGNFKQNDAGVIILDGNSKLCADFGTVNSSVYVTGTGNKIEGDAIFNQTITLADGDTVLTLALGGVLNESISLNGGTLMLDGDLTLGDSAQIMGPGLIDGQGLASLHISGTGVQWSSPLMFKNMRALTFNGTIYFTNTWRFVGDTNINGNGCLWSTRKLGVLQVDPDSIIRLNSVTLGNVSQNTFQLDETAEIHFSNAYMHNSQTLNVNTGFFVIDGGTTFMLRNYDFLFTDSAELIINGVTLWVDSFANAGITLFGKVATGKKFLSFIDGGTVKQVTDQSKVDSLATRMLLSGQVVDDITMDESISLNPKNKINYLRDAILTGSGASITCSNTVLPQFEIHANVHVTLSNLNILRMNTQSLALNNGSILEIKEKVGFEIFDDQIFAVGIIMMTGDTDIWHIRSVGGRKKVIVSPTSSNDLFDIKSNTLLLEDVELIGVENIKYETKVVNDIKIVGTIALAGSALIDIRKDTNLSFLVEGRYSGIQLLANNLKVSGNVLFGDAPENILNVYFALQSGSDLPVVTFGDNFCYMTSMGGLTGISFNTVSATLNNSSKDSLVAGERSSINGKELIITGFPIKQNSTYVTLGEGLDIKSHGFDNPIEITVNRLPTPFENLRGPLQCAYQLKNKEAIAKRSEADYEAYLEECLARNSIETRIGKIPAPIMRVKSKVAMTRAFGDISLVPGAQINRFALDIARPFSANLNGEALLEQRRGRRYQALPLRDASEFLSAANTTFDGLKLTDKFFVSGNKNIFRVHSNFNILGTIDMAESSELVFELENDAEVTFGSYDAGIIPSWEVTGAPNYILNIPKAAVIRFKGNGIVKFADLSLISCAGDAIGLSTNPFNSRQYDDSRPEIWFEDGVQLVITDHQRLTIAGKVKLNFMNNSELLIGDGHLVLGTASSDFIDLKFDRKSSLQLQFPAAVSPQGYIPKSYLSFNQGLFNLSFNNKSNLEIYDGGLMEVSMLDGVQSIGFMNSISFAKSSMFDMNLGGTMAFGDNLYAPDGGSATLPMLWENRDGMVSIGGTVKFVANDVPRTTFAGQLAKNRITRTTDTNIDIIKSLVRVTPSLIKAIDYFDPDGKYKLITSDGVTVSLQSGDVIRYESPSTNIVFGVQADGLNFRISPRGQRVVFG